MSNRVAAFAVLAAAVLAGCSKPADQPAAPPPAKGAAPSAPADDRASWPKVLNVSAIPDIKNRDQFLTTYEAFVGRLKSDLGVDVKFVPVTDYPATVDGLAGGSLDLVWYGGVTSVQAVRQSKGNCERLVTRVDEPHFRSVFVAAPDSGIKTLADLKGKTFSFGSESSTSGHIMPRYFMIQAAVDPVKDLAKFSFSGAHDATAKAVEAGTVQAGALNYLVWDAMVRDKKVDPAKVAEFYRSPEYIDYCWCARKGLPASLRKAIRDFFLGLDPSKPEDRKLLDLQKTAKYIEADDASWKVIEDAAKALGMLRD